MSNQSWNIPYPLLRVTDEYLKDLELCDMIIGENNMAICIECEYSDFSQCKNLDLPITDFVFGNRRCYALNPEGDCKGFKAKSKPETIYESKEDEKLARTD